MLYYSYFFLVFAAEFFSLFSLMSLVIKVLVLFNVNCYLKIPGLCLLGPLGIYFDTRLASHSLRRTF